MQKLLLPSNGKETVMVLTSLEEGLKATLFPQYQTALMVRSARMLLVGVAKSSVGSHMVALPEGDVSDSRTPKVLINLDLCSSAREKLVDIPTDIQSKIEEYNGLYAKYDDETITDEEVATLQQDENALRFYFGTNRSLG